MYISGVSIIGWIHTIACIVALVLGAWNIVASKRTHLHQVRGTAYAASLAIAMILTLFIYKFDVPLVRNPIPGPIFGLFHWFAVFTLFFTALGYFASLRQNRPFWAYAHPIGMTLSYYLLVAGLANEIFARVKILRPFAVTRVNGRLVFGSPAVTITHRVLELATALLLILFVVRVWRRQRRISTSPSAKTSVGTFSPQ